jgi:hypothetical protein
MSEKSRREPLKLKQICTANHGLYGLDGEGRVWKYVPAGTHAGRYSFWTKITAQWADPAQTPTYENEEIE